MSPDPSNAGWRRRNHKDVEQELDSGHHVSCHYTRSSQSCPSGRHEHLLGSQSTCLLPETDRHEQLSADRTAQVSWVILILFLFLNLRFYSFSPLCFIFFSSPVTNPSTELKQFFQNDSPKPRTNNDASRRSRIKKRINTELILESYECDKAESALLDEEEQQLHLIIGVLEDMVYEQSGNVRLINYYRDLSCLSWVL